jgi:two-component system phosphate regulon sensor histidine kinase PhoR
MLENSKAYEEILSELERLREAYADLKHSNQESLYRLEEATDTIEAIRTGEVDALVVKGSEGHQIFTLKSADQSYRIFIEQMTEGAITINENGNIVYCNSQFAKLAGSSLEKVIGQPLLKYVIHEDQQLGQELIDSAWENSDTKGELRLVDNGDPIPVQLSLKLLNLDEGICLSIILTDLTTQKENQKLLQEKNFQLGIAELKAREQNINLEAIVEARTKDLQYSIEDKTRIAEELNANKLQLQNVLATMAEGVGIVDERGKLVYANPMAQQILGISIDEIEEKIYHDPNWQKIKLDGTPVLKHEFPLFIAMNTKKSVYDFEIGIVPPDREQLYISINAAPIVDENGYVTGGIATFMDVTNRRKVIQQKDDFISVASHELKTPITSLQAALQLLNRIKDNPGEQLPKLIEQANKSMNKVSSMVEDLLNASKVTLGQLHMNTSTFKLSAVVGDSYQHIRAMEKSKIKITGDLELKVLGDPTRIEQVIINFINNAFKYAPNTEEIRVSILQQDDFVRLEVSDDGPGIAPEKLPHLFDRYYRVDDSGLQYSGLGLGLYICAEIIKKHDGEIGAESELGKGSTFWFTLPLG